MSSPDCGPLHPQMQALLDQRVRMSGLRVSDLPVAVARDALADHMERLAALGSDQGVSTEQREIAGMAGGIPARLYRPGARDPVGCVVYFHGGEYIFGGIDTHDQLCRVLADRSHAVVVSIDYRLAPEHPFPAAVEDAVASLRWVLENPQWSGAVGSDVVVAGDDVGATLAAVAALDVHHERLRLQVLLYPGTDPAGTYESHERFDGLFYRMDDRERLHQQYLAGVDPSDPRAAPLRSRSLSAAPPALVVTAEHDPLRDEGEAYAAALARAGVATTLTRVEGMCHHFCTHAPVLEPADETLTEVAAQIRSALGGRSGDHTGGSSTAGPATEVVVETTGGPVATVRRGGIVLAAGLPYAAPPVGDRRFRPPAPPEPWRGVRAASTPTPWCLQPPPRLLPSDAPSQTVGSEDCLHLHVHTPGIDGARRPVMVWLHGGGFTNGAGSEPTYDGSRLARLADVVVVTVDYRLGALGWLYPIGAGDHGDAGANLGLMDQVQALEWVQENIESFGGDPGCVTLFGHSAGAMCIAAHLAGPHAGQLFHRAIMQSGAADNVLTESRAAMVTERLMATVGVDRFGQLNRIDGRTIIKAQEVLSAELGREQAGPLLHFGPVADGVTVREHPLVGMERGLGSILPLMIGTTRDEWQGLNHRGVSDGEDLRRRLAAMVEDPDVLREAYGVTDANASLVWNVMMTDRYFRLPAVRVAEVRRRTGSSTTWRYQFDWAPPRYGHPPVAGHTIEVPFVFGSVGLPAARALIGADPPHSLIDLVRNLWTSLARTGAPLLSGDPDRWYGDQSHGVLHLDDPPRLAPDDGVERLDTWVRSGPLDGWAAESDNG